MVDMYSLLLFCASRCVLGGLYSETIIQKATYILNIQFGLKVCEPQRHSHCFVRNILKEVYLTGVNIPTYIGHFPNTGHKPKMLLQSVIVDYFKQTKYLTRAKICEPVY